MKKIFYNILFSALAFMLPFGANSQTTLEITRGDSVTLTAPDGYKAYQWQVSSDNQAYSNIPDATEQQYTFAANAPIYYRAQVTLENNRKVGVDTTLIAFNSVTYSSTISQVSAAQGYVELNGEPGSGISIPGDSRDGWTLGLTKKLTSWSNLNAHAVYYFYHRATLVDANMLITVTNNSIVQFRLRVYSCDDLATPLADTYISLKGTGSEQTIPVLGVAKFPKAAYYRYDLQCVKGNAAINNINRWVFRSTASSPTYAAAYLSSPSVHLSSWRSSKAGTPSGRAFDWCYQEIMIPEESNYTGTYAMSLGVLSGYMGIQVNGTNRHDVIFSMWDDGSTDEDPGLASYKRAGAVDASPDVTVSRFGNEGTGVKTFAAGDFWKPGTYVQFITNARPETATYEIEENGTTTTITRQNTLVSAWFNAGDGKGWQYIATTRLPGTGHYFDSWYSFLENYSWTSGQVTRKAYFRNGYIHGLNTKKWYHCNNVNFGNTDGGTQVGARTDFGQGQYSGDPTAFFMTSGGYTATNKTAKSVALNTTDTPVDTIDIERLEARVDEAIAKEEAALKAAEELEQSIIDKTGWEMVKFSSQETSGEGSNGRAAQIIDGSTSTYWHSAWQSGSASFPHWFIIDMKQQYTLNGIQFTLSGGTTRHQKEIEIQSSDDGTNFTSVYTNTDCPDTEEYYLTFDSAFTARYFKLIIKSSQSGQVHTRINELELTHPLADAISSTTTGGEADRLIVYQSTANDCLNIVSPADASKVKVRLFSIAGEQVASQHYFNVVKCEVCQLGLSALPKGVYIIQCTVQDKTYSRSIIVK